MWAVTRNSRDGVETLARLTVASPLVATTGWIQRGLKTRPKVGLAPRVNLVLPKTYRVNIFEYLLEIFSQNLLRIVNSRFEIFASFFLYDVNFCHPRSPKFRLRRLFLPLKKNVFLAYKIQNFRVCGGL